MFNKLLLFASHDIAFLRWNIEDSSVIYRKEHVQKPEEIDDYYAN